MKFTANDQNEVAQILNYISHNDFIASGDCDYIGIIRFFEMAEQKEEEIFGLEFSLDCNAVKYRFAADSEELSKKLSPAGIERLHEHFTLLKTVYP